MPDLSAIPLGECSPPVIQTNFLISTLFTLSSCSCTHWS